MAQGYRYKGDGSTFECDGGHILGVKGGFNVGIRRSVERCSMYRIRVVWLEVDALYAFKGGGFGEEVGLNEGLVTPSPTGG